MQTAALALALVGPVQGATFTVDTTLDTSNPTDGFTTLREAIDAANANAGKDVIDFDTTVFGTPGQLIELTQGQVTITGDVDLGGPGKDNVSISRDPATAANRLILIDGSTVEISDVTLTGGQAPSGEGGGGIFNNGGTLTITSSRVSGNSTTGQGGGGIFNNGGTINVTDSTIFGNDAGTGAGGGIYNDANGSVGLEGSTIDNNTAANGGGVYTRSGVSITNTTISGNAATESGGGLFATEDATSALIGSEVSGSSATNGGGIYNVGNAILVQTTIDNNTATDEGGNILSRGTLDVDDSTIQNGNGRYGGGLHNLGVAALNNTQISGNNAGSGGGGFSNHGQLTISGSSTIASNQAVRAGGGIENASNGTLTISDSTISSNSVNPPDGDASGYGGGIANYGTASISDSTITGNRIERPEPGPGVLAGGGVRIGSGGDLTITGGTVEMNRSERGVGLDVVASGRLTIAGGTMIQNNVGLSSGASEINGGGIYSVGETFLNNVTIRQNVVSGVGGGGVFNGPTTISNSNINLNSTFRSGGGVYSSDVDNLLTIIDTNLRGNSAFTTNPAGACGGGVDIRGGDLVLRDCRLEDNTAGVTAGPGIGGGGGVSVSGAGTTACILESLLTGNLTENRGGAAHVGPGAILKVYNSQVSGNYTNPSTADTGGGGIFNDNGSLMIVNSTIHGNASIGSTPLAGQNGGGISNYGSNANTTISSSTISGNIAGGSGGGVYGMAGQTTISNSIISGNDGASNAPTDDVGGAGVFSYEGVNIFGTAGTGDAEDKIETPIDTFAFPETVPSPGFDPATVMGGGLRDHGGSTLVVPILDDGPAADCADPNAVPMDLKDLDHDGNLVEPIPVDQRGLPFLRQFGAAPDIGSYEAQPDFRTTIFLPWLDQFYPGETDPEILKLIADPNNDGWANAFPLLFGGDPSKHQPELEPTTTIDDTHVIFCFRRRDGLPQLNPNVRFSRDLVIYTTAVHGQNGVTIETLNDQFGMVDGVGVDKVVVKIPHNGDLRMFVELMVGG